MSSDDRETTEASELEILRNRLANADRTVAKCEQVLTRCEAFLARQAEMNAAVHMADRVLYSPLHAAALSALDGIQYYRQGGGV